MKTLVTLMNFQDTAWTANIVAEVVLVTVIFHRQLTRRYLVLTVYVAFSAFRDVGLALSGDPAHSRLYAIAWIATQPVLTILRVGMALELFRLVCKHYPGIGGFGRTLVFALTILAIIGSTLTAGPEIAVIERQRSVIDLVVAFQRFTSTALALFLVGTALFFVRFPTAFRRNVLVHGCLLAVFFVTSSCSDLAFVFMGMRAARDLSAFMLSAAAACFLAWTFLLTRTGERKPLLSAKDVDEIERVERWNRELLKTGRWMVQ